MIRIHIGLYLEHKAGECSLGGLNDAYVGSARQRRRCPIYQGTQHLTYTEVINTGTEEHRRLLAVEKLLQIERCARAADQFGFVTHNLHLVWILLRKLFNLC